MTREEVKKIFGLIASVYPNFMPLETEQARNKLDVWHDLLQDQDFAFVEKKVIKHIRNEKFPPTISEIINHKPKETDSFLDKLEEMKKQAASPEVVQQSLAQIREILNA